MNKQAFRILGIAPTEDGRAIRSAFLRLAKIYHPDRFVGQPDDVRHEAERRMKEATMAYESLRDAKHKGKPAEEPGFQIDDKEIAERALRYRETAAKKREKDERDRERWRRWDRVEEIARKKAKLEADMAARVAEEVGENGNPASPNGPKAEPVPMKPPKPTTREDLASRLDAARRGETSPLVKRS